MAQPREMTCAELVELVTDYLEDALPAAERRRFEEHLGACSHCLGYLAQVRLTVAAAGRLREDTLPADVRDALLHAFRGWHGAAADSPG